MGDEEPRGAMGDHIVECPGCYRESTIDCDAEDRAEAAALRADGQAKLAEVYRCAAVDASGKLAVAVEALRFYEDYPKGIGRCAREALAKIDPASKGGATP